MGKSKKQEETHKSHKKSKKHSKSSSESAKESEDVSKKVSTLKRKQTELARVLQLKCAMLLQGTLSYLEYTELREELVRLNALKVTFAKQAASLEKH
ncbi:uncharacterized protein LOC126752484 [Bactrocera neohumeralis]|uniref:uncharacterized protein LOC120768492 n=1 Tax=Bactrocera tryoni TaxID=59916 RepID=UPI001A96DB38|nr:uncharacterized protein LOC120768492 [Bactrocera tryoni]XP_050319259.1 uncharacterized protein LOC126752484 [Bactrocera neohumeralis]